jgi:hypothetical protein
MLGGGGLKRPRPRLGCSTLDKIFKCVIHVQL